MNTELLKSKLLEAAFNGSLTHADTNKWEFPKIGDIAFTTSGGTPQAKNKEYYEGGYIRWIRSGELGVKYIYDSEIKITQKALENSSAKYYPVDSVLIALYGATVGKVAILKAESTSNQAVCAIFPNERFTPEYMYYFLSSQRDNFLGIASGGAQSNISQEKVKNSIIPLPSIAEQQRIVAALEEGFAYIDAVASAKQNIITAAENVRTKILQSAFNGSLTESNTENWQKVTLQSITHSVGKKDNQILASAVQKDGKFKVVSQAQELFDGYYDDESKVINDLPVIIFGDHNRNVKYIDFPFIIGADGTKCMKAEGVNPKYLYYWVQYAASTIPHRGYARHFSLLKAIPVPLPSPEEQQRIVAKIEELFEQIDKISK